MTATLDVQQRLNTDGHVWLRGALSFAELEDIRAALAEGGVGQRASLDSPLGKATCAAGVMSDLHRHLPGLHPVRLVAFAKDEAANWGVPWHQDRIVAVKDRVELPGFTNWSQKAGIWHCEPPLDVLAQMVFLRIHLDDNTAGNGAMEIACGSHKAGRISADRAAEVARGHDIRITEAAAGDVLICKMLTLHRSQPSQSGAPRRVLRLDLAAGDLPAPLE